MKTAKQEIENLRILAELFPHCDEAETVTEHMQNCVHTVSSRAATKLEEFEKALQDAEGHIAHLHKILGISEGSTIASTLEDSCKPALASAVAEVRAGIENLYNKIKSIFEKEDLC